MTLLVLVGTMLALSAIGMPLVFALLGSSYVTLLMTRPDFPLALLPQLFVQGMDQFALLAIALFFLAGELMAAAGVIQRILGFAHALVGHLRGGLAQVGILGSLVMAGISGSAVADAAAVGSVLIRSMKQAGYPAGFSAALIETASIMGPIIPPSIPMIIYAVLAGVSVGDMFLAGVLPGFLIAIGLSVVAYWRCRGMNLPMPVRADRVTIMRETRGAFFALLTPILIVGGIRGGVFTPTEGGAIAAVYVAFIGIAIYRGLSLSGFAGALVRAAHGTGSVLVILGASSIFSWIIADQGISRQFADWITSLDVATWVLVLLFNVLFLAVGMFLDPIAALIIMVPITTPLLPTLGLEPIQFGVMIILNLMIGLCTPPVGYLIFITSNIAETTPGSVIRQSAPFIAVLLVILLLVAFVPFLTMALPTSVWLQ